MDESDDMKVGIEALELLMDPEDSEVCLRKILTHKEKIDHSVLEYQGKRVAQQERWLSDLQDVNYELPSEKQELLAGLVQDKRRLQSKAAEKYSETIFEETRELQENKSKEALGTRTEVWHRCSDKALRFWHFASIVVDDVKESYTVNMCQQCYNERLTVQGLAALKCWQRKAVVEKKAHRGILWRMLGKDQFTQGMWEVFLSCMSEREEISKGCRARKAGRDTRPMATRVCCQRIHRLLANCL